MKNLARKMVLTTMLAAQLFNAPNAFSESTGGGNGGGGICITKEKCVTLAEAGLRIPRGEIQLFMVSQELEKELKRVLSVLPFGKRQKQNLLESYVGRRDTFIKVEENDKGKFKKIVKDYKSLIKQYAPSLPEERFTLYAISEGAKTYLLPKFFDLSLTDQALLLIHEGNVRGKPSSIIPAAVQFDGIVYDFLNAPEKASTVEFFLSFFDLSGNNDELFANLITYYSSQVGRQLRVQDFCPEALVWAQEPFYSASEYSVLSGGWISSYCEVNREKALEGNANIAPDFAKLFYGMSLQLNTILGGPYVSAEHSSDPFTHFFDKESIPTLCNGAKKGDQLLIPGYNQAFVAVVNCMEIDGKIVADKVHNLKISEITTR